MRFGALDVHDIDQSQPPNLRMSQVGEDLDDARDDTGDAELVLGLQNKIEQLKLNNEGWKEKTEDLERLRALEQQHKAEFTRMLDTEAEYRAQVEALQEEVNAERAKAEAAEMADVQGGVAKLQEVLEGMKVHCCMLEMPWLVFSSKLMLFLAPCACPDDEEACSGVHMQF